MHLGPVIDRDPDLCEVIDGYMSNPLWPAERDQPHPAADLRGLRLEPGGYDPARSIGQAILHLAERQPSAKCSRTSSRRIRAC